MTEKKEWRRLLIPVMGIGLLFAILSACTYFLGGDFLAFDPWNADCNGLAGVDMVDPIAQPDGKLYFGNPPVRKLFFSQTASYEKSSR